jgi:flagellar assembly factor FliW
MDLSPGRVKPKTIKLVFAASLLHCVLMVIFSTNINKINNYLSPQIIEHKKPKYKQTWLGTDTKKKKKKSQWDVK